MIVEEKNSDTSFEISQKFSLLGVLETLFRDPNFWTKYLANKHSLYFYFVMFVVGVGRSIERIELTNLKNAAKGVYTIESWPLFWMFALLFGILAGAVAY